MRSTEEDPVLAMFASLSEPDAFRAVLEREGWRCTRQRMAVYDHLLTAARAGQGHPSAEEVYLAVRKSIPSISLATVYKALEALVACRLVAKLSADDGSARYDARSEEHYHLRCLKTGAVRDLDTPYDRDLIAKIDPALTRSLEHQGFHVTGYRLELVGYFDDEKVTEPEAR